MLSIDQFGVDSIGFMSLDLVVMGRCTTRQVSLNQGYIPLIRVKYPLIRVKCPLIRVIFP
jgi:hypothetical protein